MNNMKHLYVQGFLLGSWQRFMLKDNADQETGAPFTHTEGNAGSKEFRRGSRAFPNWNLDLNTSEAGVGEAWVPKPETPLRRLTSCVTPLSFSFLMKRRK